MKTKSELIKEADSIFSQYIRKKSADWRGDAGCYTCCKRFHWKQLQCGHFLKRGNMSTRFDEDNCRVQCASCNVWNEGNYKKYTEKLKRELGDERFNALIERGKKYKQYSNENLSLLIKELKQKNESLQC